MATLSRNAPEELASTEVTSTAQRVSTIIPSYNHALFIERCLKSVLRQKLSPYELLLIDDGSTDGSVKIIENILKDCPFRCELIVRERRGLCETLNEAFAKTSGEYFAYLGSDDLWLPDFLEARVALLKSKPQAVLAYGHVFIINDEDQVTDCSAEWAPYAEGPVRDWLWQSGVFSSSVCFRRSALGERPWNENAHLEDYELLLKLSARGKWAYDPRVLSAWRQHTDNTSGNLTMMLEECLAAQRRVAPDVGMSTEELNRFQAVVKWRWAECMARAGAKAQALELVRQNWRAAPSISSAAKMLGRFVLPHAALAALRRKRQKMTAERYRRVEL